MLIFGARPPIIEARIRVQIEWLPVGQVGLRRVRPFENLLSINIHLVLACAVKPG